MTGRNGVRRTVGVQDDKAEGVYLGHNSRHGNQRAYNNILQDSIFDRVHKVRFCWSVSPTTELTHSVNIETLWRGTNEGAVIILTGNGKALLSFLSIAASALCSELVAATISTRSRKNAAIVRDSYATSMSE